MHTEELIAQGPNTYVNGRTVQFDLGDIPQQTNFGKLAAYLYRLIIIATVVVSNASGGSITLGKLKAYDFLQQAVLVTPEFQFVNLINSAGVSLAMDSYLRKMKFPPQFTDTTILNGNSATLNVVLYIDFFDARATDSVEDELMLCEILRNSVLKLIYNNCDAGGTFGAGVSCTTATTIQVFADLVARDEVRLPVLAKIEEQVGFNSLKGNIPLNGVFYTDIALQTVQAAGVSTTAYSTTDLTTLTTFGMDGVDVWKNAPVSVAVEAWNEQVFASADRLPQFQAGTCFLVPLVHLKRSSGKRTKIKIMRGNPTFNIAGSLATPSSNLRFLTRYLAPQGTSYAQKVLQRLGIWEKLGANPLAKLRVKTSRKAIGTGETTKAMVLPILVDGTPEDLLKVA